MRVFLLLLILLAQDRPEPRKSARLQKLLNASFKEALTTLRAEKWSTDKISITLLDLKNPARPLIAEHRGKASYYPASVVKMCYMAATYQWEKEGKVKIDEAALDDLRKMIGPSSNKATQRIVDQLCGTKDGPALSPKAYRKFALKRNAVNRWLHGLGLKSLNACQKTYDGGDISPRDFQFLRSGKSSGRFTNRNAMTTRDTAKLLYWIATGRVVSPEACRKMRDLMKRDLKTNRGDRKRALGGAPKGSKVWAKAGWVSNEFHEAALVELPSGRRLIVVVFTEGRAYNGTLIAEITRAICARIEK